MRWMLRRRIAAAKLLPVAFLGAAQPGELGINREPKALVRPAKS
jgi:hypothetical protein